MRVNLMAVFGCFVFLEDLWFIFFLSVGIDDGVVKLKNFFDKEAEIWLVGSGVETSLFKAIFMFN